MWKLVLRRLPLALLVAVGGASAADDQLIERMQTLDALHRDQLISDEEFEALRKDLLEALSSRSTLTAVQATNTDWVCDFDGETSTTWTYLEKPTPGDPVPEAVKQLLEEVGLPPVFVVRPATVRSAQARVTITGDRFIDYNPDVMVGLASKGSQWGVYGVLAHEMGHHFAGHTLKAGGSYPAIELEADEFAGSLLHKLGATKEEAQAAVQLQAAEAKTQTHPARSERLEAVGRGWNRSNGDVEAARERARAAQRDAELERAERERKEAEQQRRQSSTLLPTGTVTMPCGCWGAVAPNLIVPSIRCESGLEHPVMCPQFCPMGGYQFQSVCL